MWHGSSTRPSSPTGDGSDLGWFGVAAVSATALTALIEVKPPGALPLVGDTVHPMALVPVAIVGGLALRSLRERMPVRPPGDRSPAVFVVGGAVALAGVAIAADLIHPFGRGINVAWPGAFATYPVMAFLAESVLHVVPLAVVSKALASKAPALGWGTIVPVAALEAVFQTVVTSANRWFVGPHLFVIGLYELRLFRRFGFGSMLAFRLVYYLVWHVLWGRIRLDSLF